MIGLLMGQQMVLALFGSDKGTRLNTEVLDSWFQQGQSRPEEAKAPAGKPEIEGRLPRQTGNSAVEKFDKFQIWNSLRSLTGTNSDVPALPSMLGGKEIQKPAAPAARSPFQMVSEILAPESPSSRFLAQHQLLNKFISSDCIQDVSMAPDGSVRGVLKSADGYRRTLVCRADGTSSQRISGPNGEEIVRFSQSGQIIQSGDLKRERAALLAW